MIGLILAVTLATGTPEAIEHVPYSKAEVSAYIKVLRPGIEARRARHLANLITYWSDYYKVDAKLVTALIRQESNFDPGLKMCWPAPWIGPEAQTCDHGLGQINETWVRKWSLDPELLVNDESYNIAIMTRLLAWIQRYYGQEEDWYGRYHSGTPSKKREYLDQLAPLLALR